jgi:hypothetical protein
MNLIIINALIKSKRRTTSSERKISSKEVHFAVSIVAQNFIYFISISPYTVLAAIQLRNVFAAPSAEYVNQINTLYSFAILLIYIYESLPFFINLAFNKLFRSEVISIVLSALKSNNQASGLSRVT